LKGGKLVSASVIAAKNILSGGNLINAWPDPMGVALAKGLSSVLVGYL